MKITVSCDIHARQSCFVFLFYMVQCRNKIAKRRKILMMTKVGSVDLKHVKRKDFFGLCVSFSFVNYSVLKETN